MAKKTPKPQHINLDAIRLDGGTQSRVAINEEKVAEYAQILENGGDLPPGVAYYDGADMWLADGFHRWHAHNRLELEEMPVEARSGTRRDAVLHSIGANTRHGLPPNNKDKRKAATMLLKDPEWSQWSDSQIAEYCGASRSLVWNIRKELEEEQDAPTPTKRMGRDGKVRDTANIGGKSRKADKPQADKVEADGNATVVDSYDGVPVDAIECAVWELFKEDPQAPVCACHLVDHFDDKVSEATAEAVLESMMGRGELGRTWSKHDEIWSYRRAGKSPSGKQPESNTTTITSYDDDSTDTASTESANLPKKQVEEEQGGDLQMSPVDAFGLKIDGAAEELRTMAGRIRKLLGFKKEGGNWQTDCEVQHRLTYTGVITPLLEVAREMENGRPVEIDADGNVITRHDAKKREAMSK